MDRLQTNIVPADGPLDAKICFIGQAPGADEDIAIKPFVGSAGQLFNRCLRASGVQLARSQVLVNNVFAQRPPKNNVKYYFESYLNKLTWEGEEHISRLQRWLSELLERRERGAGGPNVLVALGAEALWVLTGHKRITKWRGSVLPCTLVPGFKVYASFHPSYVNRLMNEPEERLQGMKKTQKANALPLFLRDLQRIKIQSETLSPMKMERKIEINLGLNEYLERLTHLHGHSVVSVDIETIRTAEGPIVWCIGFSPSPDHAFSIPLIKRGRLHWAPQEEALLWRQISEIFLDPNVLKVGHNFAGFDLSILGRYYGVRAVSGSIADTMWCHQATHPYLLKGLDTLTSIWTWEPYYKDDGKWWDGRRISDEAEFTYNGKDCCVTREIWPLVERDAKQQGTWGNYQRHMRVMPSLLGMMIKGVKLDVRTKDDLGRAFRGRAEEAKGIIQAEYGSDLNPGSSSQLQRLLYGYLGLPIQYHHKTKKPTTDKDALNRLRKKVRANSDEGKVLSALSDYRKFDKLASTYAEMQVEPDGRVRTSYGFVSTFRLFSAESHFGGGGNLQNIPVRGEEGTMIRKLFIPDERYIMLSGDGIQAEAQEVAWLSNDLELIEAFQSGEIDVHFLRARELFDIPKEVPYNKKALFRSRMLDQEYSLYMLRRIAKQVVHATNYGMGPIMLQNILIREEIYLELKVCKMLLAQAHRKRPAIQQWHQKTREEVRTTRTLITALGDKREFRGRLNDNLFRSAYAYRPQSVVGRITQFAIQELHENSRIFRPLLNAHDEVLGQCLPRDVEGAKEEIRKAAELPHEINGRELVIRYEFKRGPSWGKMEDC